MNTSQNRIKQTFLAEQINESDFDQSIWQRSRMINNSGYLSQQYQISKQFPKIDDYHFRVQDEKTILELQNLQKQNFKNKFKQQLFVYQQKSNPKFQDKMRSLLDGLDNYKRKQNLILTNQHNQNKMIEQANSQRKQISTQTHGFYSLKDNYDDQAAIKQAYDRIKINTNIQQKMLKLSISQDNNNKPFKAKFVKKQKIKNNQTNKNALINYEDNLNNAAPSQYQNIKNISKQLRNLSINEEDL